MAKAPVFISHSSRDSEAAQAIVSELEARNLPCWIAPRDIPAGKEYDTEIVAALNACRALVVLVSADAVNSRHVRSEVARASSDGKPIYPVRLIDVEVAGGLQFHLELSQWVDFFPSPTTESYDALAKAIRSGHKTSNTQLRKRTSPKKWAVATLCGVALLIAAALTGLWGYGKYQEAQFEAQMAEETRRYEEEAAEMDRQRRIVAMERLDVNPSFQSDPDGIYLRSLYVMSNVENNEAFQVEYSLNDAEWASYPHDGKINRVRMEIIGLQSLKFRIVRPDGSVIKEMDKTDALKAVIAGARERIDYAFTQILNDNRMTCTVAGCSFRYSRSSFCDPAVTGVALVKDGTTYQIPRNYCNRLDQTQDYCVPVQDLPFKLVPGQSFSIVYHLIDGTQERIDKTVVNRLVNSLSNFAEIPELVTNDGGSAPVLVARYIAPDVVVGNYEFYSGWGDCLASGQMTSERPDVGDELMVDLDGRGLIKIGQVNSFAANFNPGETQGLSHPSAPLSLPAGRRKIRIAFGDATGVKFGPWSYDFNPADVVYQTTVAGQIPEVACSGDRYFPRHAKYYGQRQLICLPQLSYTFFDVASVEFGPEPGKFQNRIDLDFDADTYLAAKCDLNVGECPPFVFYVPESWKNVHSRVVLTNGSTISEKRHAFQK